MPFRFIHSADLHLGKRFGQFSGDLPAKLREARHGTIAKLAEHARKEGASTILLAGDTFDTETPAADVRRQALAEMHHHAPVRWVILPGNHDSIQAAQLWAMLRSDAPDNVTLAVEAAPLDLAPGVTLLPAPCTTRRPGRDTTAWMDTATTPDGVIRIGLAHGAVQSFSEEGAGLDVIAPDRAQRAGLAYLALGDWHGSVEINPRTRYSGTPEPDQFKHGRPGEALLVSIDNAMALPEITPFPTGAFIWRDLMLDLLDGDDAVARMQALMPESRLRRHALVRLLARGHVRLETRAALVAAIETVQPDFGYLAFDDDDLTTECEPEDLDAIDHGGALREAANALLAEAGNDRLSNDERAIAQAALNRLFSLAQAVKS